MIKVIYNYIFFQIYRIMLKTGEKDIPVNSAILVISGILGFNFLSIIILIDLTGFPLVIRLMNTTNIIILYTSLCILNFVYFYKKKFYKKIIEQYSLESQESQKRGWYKVLAYMVGSIILFFILAPMRLL